MNIYIQKKRWKWLLFALAVIIVSVSLWYTNRLVAKIAHEERQKVQQWAYAIQRKAALVKYTEQLFKKLEVQERKRVELWAEANKRIITAGSSEDLTFYLKIISDNTTIPVIVTNDNQEITTAINVDFDITTNKHLSQEIQQEFSIYEPFVINYYRNRNIYLYYKDSKLFSELKDVMDDLISSFISEVVINSASVPVLITDESKAHILSYGNIDTTALQSPESISRLLNSMASNNLPLEVELSDRGKNYIFYEDSFLLTQLRYYPYAQFLIIGFFLLVSYFLFNTSRKAEQNQVWMGMAKETAHQLGTPLSSLMAWIEVLRSRNMDEETLQEINKDIIRLETISERFSKIGSIPKLQNENIVQVIHNAVNYLRARTSKKVFFTINQAEDTEIYLPLNARLFEWVIENICRNAIDAMSGNGNLDIDIQTASKQVYIDITDTGKGVPKSKYKTIFNPGYTSKKTGWGLGLSLCQRIIETGHKGKVFVKKSAINKGTTFRIILNLS